MTSPMAENLGKRLERERVRRFVGRAEQLDLFTTWLTDGSFSLLWVYGPGGIGKSTLLRAFAQAAGNPGYLLARVDGARVMPTTEGIRAAVWDSLDDGIYSQFKLG